jgi:hypothetical protein
MDDLILPAVVSYRWPLAVFVVALLAFHVALVWIWPLGKIGWKKVDYIWLAFALLGGLGGVGSARQFLATGRGSLAEERVRTEAQWVLERINAGTSVAVCRQFVRSDFSPPEQEFNRIQREFDALCAWFKAASQRASSELSGGGTTTLVDLAGAPPPQVTDRWHIESLSEQVDRYNAVIRARNELAASSKPSEGEILLMIFGPYFLGVAVALRITKVTGEIRLG